MLEKVIELKNKNTIESWLEGFELLKDEIHADMSIMSLNQELGHSYRFNQWLEDIYKQLILLKEYQKAIDYCMKVIDTFKDDRYLSSFYVYLTEAKAYINNDDAIAYIQDVLKKYPNETIIIHCYIRLLEKNKCENIVDEIKTHVPLTIEHNVETEPLIKDVSRILKDLDEDLYHSYKRIPRVQDEFGKRKPQTKQATPGRNDPCPCGSGKKYKKCCGK